MKQLIFIAASLMIGASAFANNDQTPVKKDAKICGGPGLNYNTNPDSPVRLGQAHSQRVNK